jgi:protoheme IX farnesyltransferase
MRIMAYYRSLFRLPVALFVTCSAVTGHIVASTAVTEGLLFTAAGVFLLACGASALNQYQERDIDALMERTRHRPLPSGLVTPRNALTTSCTAMIAGLLFLGRSGLLPVVLGVLATVWYNGLYTPLKRRSAFAAVYGAPVGMAAPAIGWAAGGGSIGDPRLAVLALLFFLWQVPHFWLLLLRNAAQYENAGLPALTSIIPQELLSRITHLWIAAAAVASLAMPLFGIVRSPFAYAPLVLLAVWVSGSGLGIITGNTAAAALLPTFRRVNIFIFLFMLLAVFDSFLLRG